MKNTAWVFPGQGSQFVGMGRDLYEQYPEARSLFEQANDALGCDLTRLCFEGPEAELTDTINAQPALLTHSMATVAALRARLGDRLPQPVVTAGHSLGEYSALVASGALSFADGVKLVRARGVAMKRAGERRAGGMAAILGLQDDQIAAICAEAGGVQAANFNASGQIVLSGETEGLERALALARQAGAKRAIRLAVSIAAHSELMQPAVDEFRQAVMSTALKPPQLPVISNVSVQPLDSVEAIREEMLAQLTSPVRWVHSVQVMAERGVEQFLELGPKDVLSGLIKRIVPGTKAMSIGNALTIEGYSSQF